MLDCKERRGVSINVTQFCASCVDRYHTPHIAHHITHHTTHHHTSHINYQHIPHITHHIAHHASIVPAHTTAHTTNTSLIIYHLSHHRKYEAVIVGQPHDLAFCPKSRTQRVQVMQLALGPPSFVSRGQLVIDH